MTRSQLCALSLLLAFGCGKHSSSSPSANSGAGGSGTGNGSAGGNGSSTTGAGAGDATNCAALATPSRQVFPANYASNLDVSTLPADAAQTATYLGSGSLYGSAHLHPDFGTQYGIPYNIIHSTQLPASTFQNISFDASDERDPGPYPVPPNLVQEAGPFDSDQSADHHILVVDADTCKLYETYQVDVQKSPLAGYAGAVFDTSKLPSRPAGWTSSDAAGLAIFPLLVKYDEVAAGAVHHAFRFTMNHTANRYVYPATHQAGESNARLPPMGLMIRMKADVSLAGLGPQATVIATALKTYGLILADNGSSGFFQGDLNSNWNDDDLDGLKNFVLSDFEVVVPPQP